MLPTHQRLFLDDAGNWILSQQDVDSVPGAGELKGDAKAEFAKQYYDKREREETEGQVEMFEHWAEDWNIKKAKKLPLQEAKTAPASTEVSYENGKKLSRGGNVGKRKQDSITSMFYSELQENSEEADDVSQQENEEA